MAEVNRARVDAWCWAVRLFPTRSAAGKACRAGHVRVNAERAKPATLVVPGDEVVVRGGVHDRVVVVQRLIVKRVGAPVAVTCYLDRTPAPPPKEQVVVVAQRDRGTGRPTKRERRLTERLRGRQNTTP
ncbi:MAG: RNA-binding S4 domain-containing protein [Micrococcales bacterium]|nr:RNA-binding S4 domain-containing protein [Micrococcales bacterium]